MDTVPCGRAGELNRCISDIGKSAQVALLAGSHEERENLDLIKCTGRVSVFSTSRLSFSVSNLGFSPALDRSKCGGGR